MFLICVGIHSLDPTLLLPAVQILVVLILIVLLGAAKKDICVVKVLSILTSAVYQITFVAVHLIKQFVVI